MESVENRVVTRRRVDCFVGKSGAFQSIIECIQSLGPRQSSVIINGETGTGKEMVARQIHLHSPRANGMFIPVDCTALTGSIFESQLFGHVKGAFTGAVSDTLGFFRAADGGTIFLDEIGELDPELQAKLLRVLQESCVTPVGTTKQFPIDIRVICATNRDLRQMVQNGTFRPDLYFRLNVFKIELPPLRERLDDLVPLCRYFLDKQANLYGEPTKELSPECIRILKQYSWPGNVRELSNVMEHAFIASDNRIIEPDALPMDLYTESILLPELPGSFPSMDEMNKRLILKALDAANGRKLATAKLLQIDHRKLERLLDRFNIEFSWR